MRSIFKVAGLVDVLDEKLIPDAYVAVDGEVVTAYGPQSEAAAYETSSACFDFPNHFILPGLVNFHVHLCKPSNGIPFYHRQSRDEAMQNTVRNLKLELQSGVTTIRDCGDLDGVLLDFRRSMPEEQMPRMVLCGPPLTVSGGHAHFLGGVSEGYIGLRKSVERWIEAGADFIKLIATGGGTPGTHPAYASYTAADMTGAVKTAHAYGKKVSAHCRGIPGIENAIDAGIDNIEHACFELPDGTLRFDTAVADRIAEAGIYITPTIQLYRDVQSFLKCKQEDTGLTDEENAQLLGLTKTIHQKYTALRGFLKAGVPCVAGNDAGLPYTGFGCLWQELDAMISGGMTTMQAIRAGTQTAADALGMANQIGSISVGKEADLLIVEGDPLSDISALTRVRMVMLAGRIVSEKTVDPKVG
jgi:imidazolonepropionase-like amidohydrolase